MLPYRATRCVLFLAGQERTIHAHSSHGQTYKLTIFKAPSLPTLTDEHLAKTIKHPNSTFNTIKSVDKTYKNSNLVVRKYREMDELTNRRPCQKLITGPLTSNDVSSNI